MKAIETLRARLESIGAILDSDSDYTLHCDAPHGYVWVANGQMGLSILYALGRQQWLTTAIREEMPALKMGLRLADENELEDIRWNNGDDTIAAPAGAPPTIEWPKQTN